MWQAVVLLGGLTGTEKDQLTARHLASPPIRLRPQENSTDGTRSVLVGRRLQMNHERLDGVQEAEGCIKELHDVTVELWFVGCCESSLFYDTLLKGELTIKKHNTSR